MGLQTQLFSTDHDNECFLTFINDNYDCDFFQSFAIIKTDIKLQKINQCLSFSYNNILIWNKQFLWNPTYKQTNTNDHLFYIDNTSTAPIIEFTKTDWKSLKHGRIYWGKTFSGHVDYNLREFENFYKAISKWIIKSAKGKVKWTNCNIYFLDEAWDLYNKNTP